MTRKAIGLLGILAGAASLCAQGTTPPSRLAGGEWAAFDGGKGGALNALRIVNEDGKDGFWLGDAMKMTAAAAAGHFDKLKGLDVSDPEAAWDELGKRDLPPALVKALDIAIWDLHGRVKGQPVGKLLGPMQRDKVKFYLSGFPNMTVEENVRAVKETAERKVQGYRIYAYLKGHNPPRDPADAAGAAKWVESDIQLARAVKAAAPANLPLMFYPGSIYNIEQTLTVGAALDELGYSLFVDPMSDAKANAMGDFRTVRDKLRTPICAPIGGTYEMRVQWLKAGAVDMQEIDLYAGFTSCVRLVRACGKAGTPLDLHGGFPMDLYQFPLYGFVGDDVLPWIGWHGRSPKSIAVAGEFKGFETKADRPWIKRMQARPVDAEGFVRLIYEIPGMGIELDWEWIMKNRRPE